MSVNKVILIGNLGADPELKSTGGGHSVCNLSMATAENWTDKSGEKQSKTEWHRIVAFGRQAEILAEHLKKGAGLYVEGRLQTRSWEGPNGETKYSTEVVMTSFDFLGRPRANSNTDFDEDAPY